MLCGLAIVLVMLVLLARTKPIFGLFRSVSGSVLAGTALAALELVLWKWWQQSEYAMLMAMTVSLAVFVLVVGKVLKSRPKRV